VQVSRLVAAWWRATYGCGPAPEFDRLPLPVVTSCVRVDGTTACRAFKGPKSDSGAHSDSAFSASIIAMPSGVASDASTSLAVASARYRSP
jgi:hypothetical protein